MNIVGSTLWAFAAIVAGIVWVATGDIVHALVLEGATVCCLLFAILQKLDELAKGAK